MFLMAGLQDVAIIISKAENQWYFVWKALGGHGKFLFSQVLCLHRYISLFLSHIIRVCLRTLMIQKPKECRDPTDRIEDKVVCGLSLEFCQNHELSLCPEPRANCGNLHYSAREFWVLQEPLSLERVFWLSPCSVHCSV